MTTIHPNIQTKLLYKTNGYLLTQPVLINEFWPNVKTKRANT